MSDSGVSSPPVGSGVRAPRLDTLDDEQRNLAERLGGGYRVIRGVAGSGKTLVLMRRASLLAAAQPDQPFLYACFNNALAKYVREQLGGLENVMVSTVDSLALSICSGAGIEVKKDSAGFDAAAASALSLSGSGDGPIGPFHGVFVDEAQDLDEVRLDLLHSLLESPDGDFVLVKDGAQNIYRKLARWNPPGQTARGRTSLLRRNYRNTRQILELAYFFLRAGDSEESVDVEMDAPSVIVPPTTGARMGDAPRVELFDDGQAALNAICEDILESRSVGVPLDRIAVLVGGRGLRARLYHTMEEFGIPYLDLSHKKWFSPEDAAGKVHGATFQKLKGLEYQQVYVAGVDRIDAGSDVDDETRRRLLYVAMTRATDRLMVALHDQNDPLTADLLAHINAVEKPARHDEGWSADDHRQLLDGWFSEQSVEELARQLERSERAVALRLMLQHRLDVTAPPDVPVPVSAPNDEHDSVESALAAYDEECRHGISLLTCSLCLGVERYGRMVCVTPSGLAFHLRPDCDYLIAGQDFAREKQGADPLEPLMISTAQAQMRDMSPCMRCYAD